MNKSKRKIIALLLVSIFMTFSCTVLKATSSKIKEVTCPVCDHKFSARVLMSSNNFGGYDSDLCPHAMGSSPLHIRIWSCPSCFFSGYSSDFEQKFSEQEKAKLKRWLEKNFKFSQTRDRNSYDTVPSYQRYEIAAELAKQNNDQPLEIGTLYLNAAWCCRQTGAIFKNDPTKKAGSISRLSPAFEEAWKNTAKKIKPSENRAAAAADFFKKLAEDMDKFDIPENELGGAYYNLAQFIRSTGENELAKKWLKKSLKQDPSLKENIEAIKNSIKKEAFYQKKAIKWLEKGISEAELRSNQKQELLVTLADTYRRTGNFEKSVKTYLRIFEMSEISPIIIDLTRKAFKNMGRADEFPVEKIEEIEKNNIKRALAELENPMSGRNAARFLATAKKRELIFPKLVELIGSDNELVVENALTAMSDDNPEALKIKMSLFAKGKYQRYILRNIDQYSTPIPFEPLLKIFNNNEPYNLPDYLLETLAAIDDPKVEKALLKKADDFFTIEKIKQISTNGIKKNPEHKQNEELACRDLISSLSSSDNLNALKVLQRILEHSHIDSHNYGYDLVQDAGKAIEFVTNHYFGFSIVLKRSRKPQFEQPEINLANNPFGIAKNNLKNWLEQNKDKAYREIVYDGFKKAGYKVTPASDPECLEELIDGLRDRFKPVRYHSYRELEKRTGISFKPIIARNTDAFPREIGEIVWFYDDWYQKNKENLRFNKEKGQFEIDN